MRPDGLDAPIKPVLQGPRRTRHRAEVAAAAAISIVVLAAGIGLAGHGLTASPSGSPASAPSSASAPASGQAAPTPGRPTQPLPTENAGLTCAPVASGSPPVVRAGSSIEDLPPRVGTARVPGATPGPEATGIGPLPADWPIPPAEDAIHLLGKGVIVVSTDHPACIAHVMAEYAPAESTLVGPYPITLRNMAVLPVRSRVNLSEMPTGDFIVRVVTTMAKGAVGDGSPAAQAEAFFRVIVGTGALLPGPIIAPVVPCMALPADAEPPHVILVAGSGLPVPGLDRGAGQPPLVTLDPGDPAELRIDPDACARSWSITALVPSSTEPIVIERLDNPTNDPFLYAQNRWALHGLVTGRLTLVAAMRFSPDLVVEKRWFVDVGGLEFPGAVVVDATGASAPAVAACGTSWYFAGGGSGFESCVEAGIPLPLPDFVVPMGTPVHLEIPGWVINGWSAACGRFEVETSPAEPFVVVDNCNLGNRPTGPIVFVPRASGTIVRVFVEARNGDVTISGSLYASVVVTP